MVTFFSGLADSALTTLHCSLSRLDSVYAETLGQLVVKVNTLGLMRTYLTFHQVNVIFKAIAECDFLKLKYLNVSGNDLTRLHPRLLTKVIVRLEEANMYDTRLTSAQVESILNSVILAGQRRCLKLNIGGNDLSQLPPSLLAQAIVMLEEAKMFNSRLTSAQVEHILNSVILAGQRGCLKLKRLTISSCNIGIVSETAIQQVNCILKDKFILIRRLRFADWRLDSIIRERQQHVARW